MKANGALKGKAVEQAWEQEQQIVEDAFLAFINRLETDIRAAHSQHKEITLEPQSFIADKMTPTVYRVFMKMVDDYLSPRSADQFFLPKEQQSASGNNWIAHRFFTNLDCVFVEQALNTQTPDAPAGSLILKIVPPSTWKAVEQAVKKNMHEAFGKGW